MLTVARWSTIWSHCPKPSIFKAEPSLENNMFTGTFYIIQYSTKWNSSVTGIQLQYIIAKSGLPLYLEFGNFGKKNFKNLEFENFWNKTLKNLEFWTKYQKFLTILICLVVKCWFETVIYPIDIFFKFKDTFKVTLQYLFSSTSDSFLHWFKF